MLTHAGICADDQHCKIWTVAGEAKDGSFQVLVVARQVNECDHFRGTLTNLLCCPRLAVIHNLEKNKGKTFINVSCGSSNLLNDDGYRNQVFKQLHFFYNYNHTNKKTLIARYLFCGGGVSLTSPLLLKPRISKLMLEVRPVWISCRCLKRLSLALPRPLSSSPCVKTPNRVDLPESTLPSTATRRSKN